MRHFRCGHSRHGAAVVVAMACLTVVTTMLVTMLQGTLHVRRELHAQRDLRQTELLLAAGMDRAEYRLTREADYRGETWRLPADAVVGRGNAKVTIAANRESDAEPWQVDVVAEYSRGGGLSIRRSETFFVQLTTPQVQE